MYETYLWVADPRSDRHSRGSGNPVLSEPLGALVDV
jgi:hypothetical protein